MARLAFICCLDVHRNRGLIQAGKCCVPSHWAGSRSAVGGETAHLEILSLFQALHHTMVKHWFLSWCLGRSPDVRESLIEEFRLLARELDIPDDSIFILMNKGNQAIIRGLLTGASPPFCLNTSSICLSMWFSLLSTASLPP